MASAFIEAVMAQSLARRDPEVQAATEYISADAEKLRDDVRLSKAQTIDAIHAKLKALEVDAPESVRMAYEKLLAQVTG